jgi:putative ABC transport system permease protein
VYIDGHWFDLYGLQPLAGRLFRADAPEDIIPREPGRPWRVVINATAVREFGFESPQAAIGKNPFPGATNSFEIVGVIEDFRLGRFNQPMAATLYQIQPDRDLMLSVKLRGERIPETLERIDELWKELGDPNPVSRSFLSETIEQMHRGVVRQRSIFAAFAVLAVSLAIVGMLGLASSVAEERRLEIGVRKAFGATVPDVVRLVLWRFIKLAAIAGVLGCCLAVPVMKHWLEGFVDRIDLQAWMFIGTCVLIVGVAVLTVCGHALIMSRARPSDALR